MWHLQPEHSPPGPEATSSYSHSHSENPLARSCQLPSSHPHLISLDFKPDLPNPASPFRLETALRTPPSPEVPGHIMKERPFPALGLLGPRPGKNEGTATFLSPLSYAGQPHIHDASWHLVRFQSNSKSVVCASHEAVASLRILEAELLSY